MSLSSRLDRGCIEAGSWVAPEYRQDDGRAWCGNCGGIARTTQDENGTTRYEPHAMSRRMLPQPKPEWRRRMLERLAEKGRVAEKALDR